MKQALIAGFIVAVVGCGLITANFKGDAFQTYAVNSATGGGCGDNTTPLMTVNYTLKDVTNGNAIPDGCIDSISALAFTATVTGVTGSTAPNETCHGPTGDLNLQTVTLHAGTDFTLPCGASGTTGGATDTTVGVDNATNVLAATQKCLDAVAGDAAAVEFLRKAFNAKSADVAATITGGCSVGACFNVAYKVHLHVEGVVKGGGCKP